MDSVPVVFQAAGTSTESIQSSVDAFRAALGIPNNLNNPGPLLKGRREINWDGGNPNILDTTAPVTPFNVFLNTRGSQFTTPGLGLSQAPPSGGPQGGLAVLFSNPTYAKTFRTFSPSRLFTPVGSNITNASFFIPGTNGTVPATVRGFGAVFTDVDQQADGKPNSQGQHADRVPRQGQQDLIQQFRTGFTGRWKPVLLRHRVWRRAHCVGTDPSRQRCPGAERRCPS